MASEAEKWDRAESALRDVSEESRVDLADPGEVVAATPTNVSDFEAFKADREAQKLVDAKRANDVRRSMQSIVPEVQLNSIDDQISRESRKALKPRVWMSGAPTTPIPGGERAGKMLTRRQLQKDRGLIARITEWWASR